MNRDMREGEVSSALLRFCIPLVLTGILQQMYTIVDSLMVGNFIGETALGAVNSCNVILTLFNFLVPGLVSGCTILVSHAYGAGRKNEVEGLAITSAVVLSGAALCTALVGAAVSQGLLLLLGTPALLLEGASTYLSIMVWGIPFTAFYNLACAVLRGVGDSKTPLYALAVSSVVNLTLDFYFIYYLHWGVAGTAWATVAAQALSALFSLVRLVHVMHSQGCQFSLRCFNLPLFGQSLRLSLPRILQSTAVSIGQLLLTNVRNSLGAVVVTAITTAYKVDTLILLPLANIAMAVSVFTGVNLGAGSAARAKEGLRRGLQMVVLYTCVAIVLMLAGGRWFLACFGISQQCVSLGYRFFCTCAIFYPLNGIYEVCAAYLQGCKKVVLASVVAVLTLGVRVGFSYLLVGRLGADVIAVAEMCSWLFGAVATALACRRLALPAENAAMAETPQN